jgi:hypothetical protein
MPIQTICPACEKGYTLPDTQRGKRVRCKNCQGTFVVGGESAGNGTATATAEDDVPVLREVTEEEARRIKAENRLARSAGKLPAAAVTAGGPRRPARDEDEDEGRPSRGPAPKKKSNMPLLLIGGGALFVLFLLCAGGGILTYALWPSSDDDSSQQADNNGSPAPDAKPPFGANPFGNNPLAKNGPGNPAPNNPFKGPDNPFRPPVGGQPAVPRDDPFAQPTSVDKALTMLRDEQIRRRQVAADWLSNRASDPTRQKEVAQALEPLLDDGQTREQAARAMAKWATKDNVPALVKALDFEGGNAWRPIIEALTRLKDERSAAVLAAQLAVFPRGDEAARALQAVGPPAEKEVAKYIHHKDFGARQKASQLLKRYNTKDEVLVGQCVADLAAAEPETKRLAAEDLAKLKAGPEQRDEVARALDPLVTDTDFRLRNAAVTALGTWAIKDNALSLAKSLEDGGVRDKALAILISLKPVDNDQALALVAQHLQKPDRRKFSVALVQMGKPAKVEDLALKVLINPANDHFTREEAVEILATVGTRSSIAPLQAVARAMAQSDRTLATKCLAAAKVIQARSAKK